MIVITLKNILFASRFGKKRILPRQLCLVIHIFCEECTFGPIFQKQLYDSSKELD